MGVLMQLYIVIKSGQRQRVLAMKNARANRTGAFGQMDGMATETGCQEYATTMEVEYGSFLIGCSVNCRQVRLNRFSINALHNYLSSMRCFSSITL